MAKVFFIGGAPRSGKSTAMQRFLAKKPIFAASTDAIRDVLKGVLDKAENPDLFKAGRGPLDSERNVKAMLERPETVIPHHTKESEFVWKSVRTFLDCNVNNERDSIIEGVAILPHHLRSYEHNFSAVFIVNLADQTEAMLAHSKANSHDWLNFYGEDAVRAFGHFNQALNRHYYDEAKKHGLPVVVVGEDFSKSVDEAVNILLQSS